MKSPRNIQILLVVGIAMLVGFLFTQDIKGLESTNDADAPTAMAEEAPMPTLDLAEVSTTAKNLISNAAAKNFDLLEAAFGKAKGAEKVSQAKVLAQRWDDLEQAIPSALYLEQVAQGEKSLQNWVKAGDRFLKAFDNTQDSIAKPIMLQKAHHAYTEAMQIDSTSLDAKTGKGIAIVNGMGAPMQGITLLLDVVKEDPKNFKANMNLGTFAMKSGQFDKAITRFEGVVKNIKATPDAYFYLATAYENLGKKQEAIDAYLQSKKLAANPTLSSFIDKKVAELKK